MNDISKPLSGTIREGIIGALLAVELKAVPSNARYLGVLAKEKYKVLQRLQEVLAQSSIFLEPAVFEADNLSGQQIFRAIQQQGSGTAEIVILNDRKLRESVFLIESVLNRFVSFTYSRIIAQQLIHIEFLDDQIACVLDEIEYDINHSEQESSSISWQERFREDNTVSPVPAASNLVFSY